MIMTEEQRAKLMRILIETWNRQQSADDAFEDMEDLIWEIRGDAMRSVE